MGTPVNETVRGRLGCKPGEENQCPNLPKNKNAWPG
jgi:hypothetical protein